MWVTAISLAMLAAGIMLVDRNDELCVLYEKANIQVRGHQHETSRGCNATARD
jgi:hypothetical protein